MERLSKFSCVCSAYSGFVFISKIQYLREAANDTSEELKPASLP